MTRDGIKNGFDKHRLCAVKISFNTDILIKPRECTRHSTRLTMTNDGIDDLLKPWTQGASTQINRPYQLPQRKAHFFFYYRRLSHVGYSKKR